MCTRSAWATRVLAASAVMVLAACSSGPTGPTTDHASPSLSADKGPCGPRDAYSNGNLKHCHP
jgi:hypothetical protein